jgi:tRNA(Ile)-lysidine synthase
VALSGGLDSTVLLAALAALRNQPGLPPLRAIHVDHGLHADSDLWANHCARVAANLGVSLEQVKVDARPAPGDSPEAAARNARYAALAANLERHEVLLTAHHADDQLETILLQWLRGGGLRAVAGMPPLARFEPGWHARPLLGFERGELHAWARESGLEWLDDPSNANRRFDRNYLRLDVLPAIRRRWPAAARTVGRVAAQAAEALEVEHALAAADLEVVRDGGALSLERLLALPAARQRWALRAWLRELGLPVPPAATLAALLHDVGAAAADRVPCVNWPGARVHRYRGRLFADASVTQLEVRAGAWRVDGPYDLGATSRLELRASQGVGLSRARLPRELSVVARTVGEVFRPAGASHHRPMRKWLQERGGLPWQRGRLPLVMCGGEVVAIGDLAYGGGLEAAPDEPSLAIAWVGRPVITESEAIGMDPAR